MCPSALFERYNASDLCGKIQITWSTAVDSFKACKMVSKTENGTGTRELRSSTTLFVVGLFLLFLLFFWLGCLFLLSFLFFLFPPSLDPSPVQFICKGPTLLRSFIDPTTTIKGLIGLASSMPKTVLANTTLFQLHKCPPTRLVWHPPRVLSTSRYQTNDVPLH